MRNDPSKPVLKLCIVGPESTGKSTLALRLAAHFKTVCTQEAAKDMIAAKNGQVDYEDMTRFAHAQVAVEEELMTKANRILVCDTDPLTTQLWSEVIFGQCPPDVAALAAARSASYDHTIVTDIDVPWVDDVHRIDPHGREDFMKRCVAALNAHHRPFTIVSGDWEQRFQSSCIIMEKMLLKPK